MVSETFSQPYFIWMSDERVCQDCYTSLTSSYLASESWLLTSTTKDNRQKGIEANRRIVCNKCDRWYKLLDILLW